MVTTPTPSAARVLQRLDDLADLRRGPRGGADRPGFSADEQAAHDLVAAWMREAGLEVAIEGRGTLAVVAFRDEEGWRFGRGLTGSRALCGRLGPAELQSVDADGVTLGVALAALGLEPPPPAGWLAPGR